MKLVAVILIALSLTLTSCSEEGVIVDTGINPGSLTPGTVLFTLDGIEYRAPVGSVSSKDNRDESELEVVVIDGTRLFALLLENFVGVQEYTVTPQTSSILFRYDDTGNYTFDTQQSGGSVSISQYSTLGAAGTFEATLINRSNPSDTLVITDGAFNVEF